MAAASLKRRLSGYWKMEAGNVVLLPVILLMVARWTPSWVTLVSFIPMMLLLLIGAYYWRAKLKQLEDRSYDLSGAMRVISVSQGLALILTLVAGGAVLYAWTRPDIFNSGWDQGVATFAALLALLEYVNYYHRQLQHFDHGPDFKRLLSGNGLRPSQMARDLKTYRRT
ncbi:MAG: hypothetical protein NXH78_09830 [Hyphomonadaceae bacterium]|nr:hypothetical protein [Hyphomonadaceae bacterium]